MTDHFSLDKIERKLPLEYFEAVTKFSFRAFKSGLLIEALRAWEKFDRHFKCD